MKGIIVIELDFDMDEENFDPNPFVSAIHSIRSVRTPEMTDTIMAAIDAPAQAVIDYLSDRREKL